MFKLLEVIRTKFEFYFVSYSLTRKGGKGLCCLGWFDLVKDSWQKATSAQVKNISISSPCDASVQGSRNGFQLMQDGIFGKLKTLYSHHVGRGGGEFFIFCFWMGYGGEGEGRGYWIFWLLLLNGLCFQFECLELSIKFHQTNQYFGDKNVNHLEMFWYNTGFGETRFDENQDFFILRFLPK